MLELRGVGKHEESVHKRASTGYRWRMVILYPLKYILPKSLSKFKKSLLSFLKRRTEILYFFIWWHSLLDNVNKFLYMSINKIIKKSKLLMFQKVENFLYFKQVNTFLKFKVSWTSFKLSQCSRSYKLNVNPKGYVMPNFSLRNTLILHWFTFCRDNFLIDLLVGTSNLY